MINNLTMARLNELNARTPNAVGGGQDVFPDCKTWIPVPLYNGAVDQYKLSKDNPLCFAGNALISSKGEYTVTNAHFDINTGEYSKETPVKNALAVLGAQINATSQYNAYFVVETESTSEITLNIMNVPYSQFYSYEFEQNGIKIKQEIGYKNVVSTKKSGSLDVGLFLSSNCEDNSCVYTTYRTNALASYRTKRSASVTIPSNYAISVLTESGYNEYSTSGSIPESMRLYSTLTKYINPGNQLKGTYSTTEAMCSIEFGDKADSGKQATDFSEDDWAFPEITVTLSSKGGVFTKEDIDTSFPLDQNSKDSGLSTGAIAGIVIGCIAAAVIIGLCVYCLVFRRKSISAISQDEAQPKNII